MSNFDPCECIDIYNHENAMRRLINMLRDSQNACTDSGCEIRLQITPGWCGQSECHNYNFFGGSMRYLGFAMWLAILMILLVLLISAASEPASPNCTEGYMMLMLGWVVVATLLYLMRPKTLRLRGDEKPAPSSGEGPGSPPAGPSVH